MLPDRVKPLLEPGAPSMEIARLFDAAGFEIFLVGGSVRDVFLKRADPAADLDFATNARPPDIRAVVGDWADDVYVAGEVFGTVGAIRRGHVYEITTFRSEVYRPQSRKPEVEFSDDIETDLSRRDFSVNAMALRLPEPEMIDPWGGLADLSARVLRTPLGPEVSFGDDPLRMLRLYRFVSTLGFSPAPAAAAAVAAMRERISIVSLERIQVELSRLLTGEHVAAALTGLVDSGLAGLFLPELSALALEQDPRQQHKDVLAHTIAVVEKCPPDEVLRLAALMHDIGKPETRSYGPDGVSFHHHEVVGARMARARLRTLRYPNRVVEDVSRLVYLHMRPHTFKMGWTDKAVRRYVRDAGPLLSQLNTLVRCDVTTRNRRLERTIQNRIDELEERIEELRREEELDAIRPPIDGNQVMEHLGIGPGPRVGEAMQMLLDHRLDHGPYTEEEAFRLLDEWAGD